MEKLGLQVLPGSSVEPVPVSKPAPNALPKTILNAYRPRPPGQLPDSPPSFQEIKLSLNFHALLH